MKLRKTTGRDILIVTACSALLVAGASFLVQRFGTAPVSMTYTVPDRNDITGSVIRTPDGEGKCHRRIFDNNTGQIAYLGVGSCDPNASRGAQGNLPPVLRATQDWLRGR